MTGNFKYVGINLSGLIQEFVLKERIPFVFLLRFVLKDNNNTIHWVGHYKSKPQDLEHFKRKK